MSFSLPNSNGIYKLKKMQWKENTNLFMSNIEQSLFSQIQWLLTLKAVLKKDSGSRRRLRDAWEKPADIALLLGLYKLSHPSILPSLDLTMPRQRRFLVLKSFSEGSEPTKIGVKNAITSIIIILLAINFRYICRQVYLNMHIYLCS